MQHFPRASLLVASLFTAACSAGGHGPPDGTPCDGCTNIDAALDTHPADTLLGDHVTSTDGPHGDVATACTMDGATCPSGTYCDTSTGTCTPSRGTCTTDDNCSNDSHCVMGECVPYASGQTNPMCTRPPIPAFLTPAVLCRSAAIPSTDPFPSLVNIAPAVMAANFGFGGGDGGAPHPSVVAVMGGGGEGGQGAVRIFDGATCALQYTIDAHVVEQDSSPTIGDLDGDGFPEIISASYPDSRTGVADPTDGGLVAFRFDHASNTWRLLWRSHHADGSEDTNYSGENWNSPSIADLDDDGIPEITYGGIVYDHSGLVLDEHLAASTGYSVGIFGVTADVDNDARHIPELVTGTAIYSWDTVMHQWSVASFWNPPATLAQGHVAVADFGDFPGTNHGDPEVAVISSGMARVQTIHGDVVFGPYAIPGGGTGGPPTAADFNGDHRADFATAALARYIVFDLNCDSNPPPAGCEAQGVRWSRPNQDASSNVTGSSVFDFNGDGAAEAVYADECFTRVYDGTTGNVLFSRYRSSGTWYEYPIVADVNGDLKAEIAVGANLDAPSCATLAPNGYDSTFAGLRCATNADCPMATHCDSGLCRCASDTDCDDPGFGCRPPDTGTPGTGNVCRALVGTPFGGIEIFGDPRGRWTPSRPIWNEHTYTITNVGDTGSIPASHARSPNWLTPGLNNFRQNTQGTLSPNSVPDLTAGPGTAGPCVSTGATSAQVALSSPVCNRGTAPVASGVTIAFDVVGGAAADGGAFVACTAVTNMQLAPGACETVSCTWNMVPPGTAYEIAIVPDPAHAVLQCLSNNDQGTDMMVDCRSPG